MRSRISCLAAAVFAGSAAAQTTLTPFTNASSNAAYGTSANGTTITNCLPYVNQLVGTNNGGNSFAGASLPYGMAKAVADVTGENTGGFAPDGSPVQGFSQQHDSGTGGEPSLGLFEIMPCTGCGDIDTCAYSFPKARRAQNVVANSVNASPGYFDISLGNGSVTRAEMTVTEHTALYRFTMPDTDNPLIMVDLTDLQDSRFNGSVAADSTTGRLAGNATFKPSFGSGTYNSYFCIDFQGSKVKDTGIWVNDRSASGAGSPQSLFITQGINGFPLGGGAWTRFSGDSKTIYARVGVSFISTAQACGNAEKEIPDFNFGSVKAAAQKAWEEKLAPITIQTGGVSNDYLVNFCSGIYRAMQSPQDYTGENPRWTSTAPYFDSFYCIWDHFRAQFPLLTVVDPTQMSRIVQSLIDIYEHQGWLPDCRMSTCKGYTQGGSNADVVIADAYVKNLTGIDWTKAYKAVVNDAENEPIDWSNEGRGGLMSWKSLGYIPASDFDYIGFGTMTRSISRTLEYAYNDFNVATLAAGISKTDYAKYAARSGNWANLYLANQTSYVNGSTNTGFTGFFQPRYLNGTFGFQAPSECSNLAENNNDICSLQNTAHETFESSIWEYSFYVPHDMAALIKMYGGATTFTNRLNYLHDSGITYIGNEPAFLTVYQFHYAGRPGQSAKRSHFYIPSQFSPTPDGLPGNDDSGAMGSFLAFNMMGLLPVPGQSVYLISAPYFKSVSVTSPLTNKTATITNKNFDPSYKAIYIQSATLNGKNYTKNWIDHSFFLKGGVLELTLGTKESSWGTAAADLPPSLSTGHLNGRSAMGAVGTDSLMGMAWS